MPVQQTPMQELAEVYLGRSLADYVLEKRRARPKWSWVLIAEQLHADTGGRANISHEALRSWYRHADAA